LSGENGKIKKDTVIIKKTIPGEVRRRSCPVGPCGGDTVVWGAEHYMAVNPKCSEGHPFLVYYSPDKHTYLLEAVETA